MYSLTSITIPASITAIGKWAFLRCSSLATVTFEGTITPANFNDDANTFPGDLRAKYLTGGAGTYTKRGNAWTKQ